MRRSEIELRRFVKSSEVGALSPTERLVRYIEYIYIYIYSKILALPPLWVWWVCTLGGPFVAENL